MGSELQLSSPAEACAVAVGTAELVRLELVGPEGVIASVEGDGSRAELTSTVSGPYVYARVTQVDGEMAWSSPIFIDVVTADAAE